MEEESLSPEIETRLLGSLHSTRLISGFTHNFYRYPARMSPDFAREVIVHFSRPGDMVLDPFMGGGTTLIEALAHGRRSIGVDLNPLAAFVTTAKTTPLSSHDAVTMMRWSEDVPASDLYCVTKDKTSTDPRAKNLPPEFVHIFHGFLRHLNELPYPRQRQFARCALLRLGQWAVDCKSDVPEWPRMQQELYKIIQDMLKGLEQLVQSAGAHGVAKRHMTGNRSILLRSSIGLEESVPFETGPRPRLVLTSPPYPAVHVLYNRWQVRGRRETPAPYWLIGASDGHGASYFTLGSRSAGGIDNYFQSIRSVFRSVRAVIDPDGLVVQLVSFSDAESQLSAFLQSMEEAGFREVTPTIASRDERWRKVPNRRWYNRIEATRESAHELLLFHRPN